MHTWGTLTAPHVHPGHTHRYSMLLGTYTQVQAHRRAPRSTLSLATVLTALSLQVWG